MDIEELKSKFSIQNIMPHGEVIVIPGDKFDPDWEADLGDQGYACHNLNIAKDPFVIVPLKKDVNPGQSVYVPKKEPLTGDTKKSVSTGFMPGSTLVTDPDSEERGFERKTQADELIIKLWNEKKTYEVIKEEVHKQFPEISV